MPIPLSRMTITELEEAAESAHKQQSFCLSIEYKAYCNLEDEYRAEIARRGQHDIRQPDGTDPQAGQPDHE